MAQVKKTPDGHWMWTGPVTEKGYGLFRDGDQRMVRAHRWSYKHFKGPIPPGEVVRHRCDINDCVNPHCLLTGTQAQNQQDMLERGRLGRRSQQARVNGRSGNAKLSRQAASEIRVKYARGGWTHRSLAAAYGVHHTSVRYVLIGRTWND